jgi:hypothetical protein
MAVDIINPDRFLIGLNNYTPDAYSKNGTDRLGGYDGRVSYCWESLMAIDLSGIPAGATIDSVTLDVNVTANNSASLHALEVHEQTLVSSWTDTPSTEPDRNTPAGFDTLTVLATLSSSATFNGTGLKTIPTSASLVALFQDFLDGVKSGSKGIMVSYYTGYFGYYLNQDSITINVTYTGGGGGGSEGNFFLVF